MSEIKEEMINKKISDTKEHVKEEHLEEEHKEEDEEDGKDEEEEAEHVILDVSSARGNTIISIQPHTKNAGETRTPLPITVSGPDSRISQILPLSGLQMLYDQTRLRIQQSYDIHYLTSGLTSENRYVVRSAERAQGEALFGCCESSASWQRLLCGAKRRLDLTLVDQTQQEAATFHRRLASTVPQLGVYLQRMDAYLPGGEHIGSVEQEWSPGYPNFTIRDANRTILYRIRANNCCTCTQTDFVFYILNANDSEVLSHISHDWDRDLVDYDLTVVLPPTQSIKSKTLVLAAAFLLEYMYFLPGKESSCFRSCCK